MRTVFLTPGGLGSGEIINAVLVADQLRKKGVDCSFLTFPYGARFIRTYEFEHVLLKDDKLTNINSMKEHLEKTHPDAIVIADYYLFHMSKSLSEYLWVGWMKDLGIPVVSFDSLCLGREYPKAIYIANPELFPKPKFNITYKMPSFIQTLISPCPPFNSQPQDERDSCGRLYEETFTTFKPAPAKEELGINPDEKLVFHIIPKWALMTLEGGSLMSFPEYYPMLAAVLSHHFRNLDERIHLVCVSPTDKKLYTETDKLKVNQVDFLPFDVYMKYMTSADLVITDNILSATTWKAVLHRVPVLVLGNSLTAKDPGSKFDTISEHFTISDEFTEVLCTYMKDSILNLPILSFWTVFTKRFASMDIVKTFLIKELFDEKGTFETISSILTDETFKKELRKRQDAYVQKTAKMPTMADIVLSIAREGGSQK